MYLGWVICTCLKATFARPVNFWEEHFDEYKYTIHCVCFLSWINMMTKFPFLMGNQVHFNWIILFYKQCFREETKTFRFHQKKINFTILIFFSWNWNKLMSKNIFEKNKSQKCVENIIKFKRKIWPVVESILTPNLFKQWIQSTISFVVVI